MRCPLVAEVAQFYIYWELDDRRNFDLDVPFRGRLRGAELRAAIAEKRSERPSAMKLEQYRARRRSDGAPVVSAYGVGFVTAAGEEVPYGEREEDHYAVIADSEELLTPKGQRALIWVNRA